MTLIHLLAKIVIPHPPPPPLDFLKQTNVQVTVMKYLYESLKDFEVLIS